MPDGKEILSEYEQTLEMIWNAAGEWFTFAIPGMTSTPLPKFSELSGVQKVMFSDATNEPFALIMEAAARTVGVEI